MYKKVRLDYACERTEVKLSKLSIYTIHKQTKFGNDSSPSNHILIVTAEIVHFVLVNLYFNVPTWGRSTQKYCLGGKSEKSMEGH